MILISFAILVVAYTFFHFISVTYKTSRIQNYFREFCAFQVITRNPIKELRNDKNIPHLAFLSIQATWTLITKKSTIDFHFQSHNWRWNIVLISFHWKDIVYSQFEYPIFPCTSFCWCRAELRLSSYIFCGI